MLVFPLVLSIQYQFILIVDIAIFSDFIYYLILHVWIRVNTRAKSKVVLLKQWYGHCTNTIFHRFVFLLRYNPVYWSFARFSKGGVDIFPISQGSMWIKDVSLNDCQKWKDYVCPDPYRVDLTWYQNNISPL